MDERYDTPYSAPGQPSPGPQRPNNPKDASGFFKVWRVIYPPLLFILIQIVVTMAGGLAYAIRQVVNAVPGVPNISSLTGQISEYILSNTLLFLFLSGLVSLPLFFLLYRRQNRGRPKARHAPVMGVDLALILGLSAVSNFAISALLEGFDLTRYFADYQVIEQMIASGPLLIQVLSVGIVSPVVEEFLMRGVVMGRLRDYVRPVPALLIQAVIFGLLHMNLLQGLYAFVIGVLFGFLCTKYGLGASILSHLAFNLSSVLFSAVMSGLQLSWSPLAVLVPALLLCAVLLRAVIRRPGPETAESERHGAPPSGV